MSHDQDFFIDVERDIIAPLRSPGLEPVNPEYGPRSSPAPLVRVDELSSDSSEAEDSDTLGRRQKTIARKGRANRTFADGVLILALDPNQRTLASQARRAPLDSRSRSEEEDEEDEEEDGGSSDEDDHDDGDNNNAIQDDPRPMRGSGRVVRIGANPDLVKAKPTPQTAFVVDPVGRDDIDDDDDFPMIDSPATLAEEHPVQSPPVPTQAIHNPEREAPASNAASNQVDLLRKQFNTIPPPRTRPLFPNLRLNLVPSVRDGDQDDDSILKSPILGKYAISPRDAHPDFTLPAMQQRSPPRSSPAGLADYRTTLPSLKIAIGDVPEPSPGAFACPSPGIGRALSGQFVSYASPASYSAYSAMSPPDPPSHTNWRTATGNSNTSTFSDYTSSTSISASTPASSIITPSPAASGPSSLVALPERTHEGQEEYSGTWQVSTMEIDLTSPGEVRSVPQPQPQHEVDSKSQPHPAVQMKVQYQRTTRPQSHSKSAARARPQVQLQSPPAPEPRPQRRSQPESQTEAESRAGSVTESELSELSELESVPDSEAEPAPKQQSRLQPKRPSVSQPMTQPEAGPNAVAIARFSLGPFKCTYEGCNAAPFQTQYLLNSHMNVHSDTRTHFCPVKDCPRGHGGLGFKRKNEMIR
ncbi:hypothetical protein AYO21_04480 [Fonsecaea monophora]|uniref:C2H2-type domain-containing protein n=1 Tax=Fonsecaea monophora TaxID=254056 RepID=A0A177FAK8_9EURO|nr:hypothetical protein AYO21_04480 [Fonsecaea monophora]KAH0833738.1 hypothetical protein FOPE_03325 [Fonsecaea pedrosoi]OAG41317.1 hypothetical protein AYO21_04480 [Fonsecaea monophora]